MIYSSVCLVDSAVEWEEKRIEAQNEHLKKENDEKQTNVDSNRQIWYSQLSASILISYYPFLLKLIK